MKLKEVFVVDLALLLLIVAFVFVVISVFVAGRFGFLKRAQNFN